MLSRSVEPDLLTRTVLLVDDEPENLSVLQSMLEDEYHVRVTTSPEEALRIVSDGGLDTIVTDLRMPGMDGVELLERTRKLRSDVMGVILTAYTDTPALLSAINNAHAFRYLKKPWQPDEVFKALADAGEAVRERRAVSRLTRLADTDALTGVPNRRHFEEIYTSEHERLRRYRRPMALLLLDLDHFKTINDTKGHLAGDDVLKAVATSLAGVLRQSDHLARVGGEEFAIVVTETGPAGAAVLAERLRHNIEGLSVPCAGGPLRVTVSVGVAACDGRSDVERDTLFRVADRMLYEAKQGGRNRICFSLVSDEGEDGDGGPSRSVA
jgi:diguanylate cyclase (GGDEF)-like protein